MTKSKTTRALLAATCVAGSACVSGPQLRDPPKPAECPSGSVEAMFERFKATPYSAEPILIHGAETDSGTVLSEGPVSGEIYRPFGTLPGHLHIYGELVFRKGYVYGRFTRARLPDGEIIPVCLELVTFEGLGVPMKPGSTSKKARISNLLIVQPVERFH